ncbi:MAG: phytanoyl-CoA dioxygenase [Acidobacteria bacterium]|nr:MAG: phytanoyl-CoA dioxygenase [Acidobacteriota bacterium]
MSGIASTFSRSNELWANGHVLITAAASTDEIDEYRSAINDAVLRLSNETRSLGDRSTYDKAFLQVTNLWQKDEAVKSFVFEKQFARIAADLLGVEKVRLYHDQALFKEPGGGHTPWHQDKYYWPLDTEKMITMWMPLVDIDEEMGIITFASGSHAHGPINNVEISDESEELFQRYISENKFPIAKASSMKAGDATFHLGWTIHSASANRSSKMREVMTIIYFEDGARVTELTSIHQQADLDAWLRGKRPGEIADSEMNPIMN